MNPLPLLALSGLVLVTSVAAAAPRTDDDARFTRLYLQEWAWREKHVAPDEDDATRIRPFLPDVTKSGLNFSR